MKCLNSILHREKERETRSGALSDLLEGAIIIPDLALMKAQGDYPGGKPEGILIHHTAGNQAQSANDAIAYALKNGHGYLFIDQFGDLYQQLELNKWYFHAGKSQGTKGSTLHNAFNLSNRTIGIEVAGAGKLVQHGDVFKSWYGQTISNLRIVSQMHGYVHGGAYQSFTPAQEMTLKRVCAELCLRFSIPVQNVMGHDEVAPQRKNDPGGSLSCNMSDFRFLVRDMVKAKSVNGWA